MAELSASTGMEHIAAWSTRLEYADIPEAVRRIACRCLIDTLGVAIAGSRRGVLAAIRSFARAQYAAGDATVLGAAWRLTPAGGAFVNAASAHVLDFDDNCYAGSVHGSAVIVPAVLAAAEAEDLPGVALLTAFVAGAEAEYAVGDALTDRLYRKGWWTTGVLGPVGAAVATCRAMHLDARATGRALGLAIGGTGGAKACFGTDAKPVLCGRAAEAGMNVAQLAARGISGPIDALESVRGLAALFNDGVFEPEALQVLGKRWRLLDPGIDVKRIPLCLSTHAAVDGILAVLAEHRLATAAIERVVCDVPPGVAANLPYAQPKTVQQAQFSMNFAVAAALVFGDVSLIHLDDAVLAHPGLIEMLQRVEMLTSPRWNDVDRRHHFPEGAFVKLLTRDGRSIEHFTGSARGTAGVPLTDSEIETKFTDCAGGVIGGRQTEVLLGRLLSVASLRSVRELLHGIDWSEADGRTPTGGQP